MENSFLSSINNLIVFHCELLNCSGIFSSSITWKYNLDYRKKVTISHSVLLNIAKAKFLTGVWEGIERDYQVLQRLAYCWLRKGQWSSGDEGEPSRIRISKEHLFDRHWWNFKHVSGIVVVGRIPNSRCCKESMVCKALPCKIVFHPFFHSFPVCLSTGNQESLCP